MGKATFLKYYCGACFWCYGTHAALHNVEEGQRVRGKHDSARNLIFIHNDGNAVEFNSDGGLGEAVNLNCFSDEIHGLPPIKKFIFTFGTYPRVPAVRGEYTPVETKTTVTRLPDVVRNKVSGKGKLRSGGMGIESGRGSRKLRSLSLGVAHL